MLADVVVASPPYAESINRFDPVETDEKARKNYPGWHSAGKAGYALNYGASPGQLGAMKPGTIDAIRCGAKTMSKAKVKFRRETWQGCYDASWKGLIVDDAFAHPAKFARTLIGRIYRHMIERGWLSPGMTVIDPFGGVGLGALDAMANGLHWVGVELEKDFFILGNRNIHRWITKGYGHADYGQACLCELQEIISQDVRRGQSNGETKDRAVLFEGLQEHVSLQGSEAQRGKSGGAARQDAVEQGQAVVGVGPPKDKSSGEQRQSLDGKKRPLARGPIRQSERLRGDKGERQAEAGASARNGTTPGPDAGTDRTCSSQGRQQAEQRDREPGDSHSIFAHEAPSSARHQTPRCQKCGKLKLPYPTLLNGDSRNLVAVVGEACGVVASPPWESGTSGHDHDFDKTAASVPSRKNAGPVAKHYGTSPGQLGAMKPGSLDAVVSSPPYASGTVHETNGIDREKTSRPSSGPGGNLQMQGYGQTPGNLGNLKPGSVEAVVTPQADCVVSSPPFMENNVNIGAVGDTLAMRQQIHNSSKLEQSYGVADGQLGNETSGTFWESAKIIVQQCYAILRPGGVAAFVCKDFVRNKQRVPFSADWVRLCESCGFVLVEWVQASLVKDLGKHRDLYGDEHHRKTERKSFFRRLAEKKGSPRIDHEDIVFLRKPA